MRCSWIEKNGSRNIIDWERTKNDVISVVSLFGGIWFTRPRVAGGAGLVTKTFAGGFPRLFLLLPSARGGAFELDASYGDTHESSGPPGHTCSTLQRQCGELGCLVELVDEAPQRMA